MEIEQDTFLKVFYLSGMFIFLIVGFTNFYTNYVLWDNMIISARISSVFSNIFNFMLSALFLFLLKGLKPNIKPLGNKDVEEIIREAKK